MINKTWSFLLVLLIYDLNLTQNQPHKMFTKSGQSYNLYPVVYQVKPELQSPIFSDNNREVVLTKLKNGGYTFVDVTVENGKPLHYSYRVGTKFGKDQQLIVDSGDFPTLAKTGYHSSIELKNKKMITGVPLSVINYIGRPNRYSHAGFLGENEDIISILKFDNNLAKQLNLTHPQLAKPLFHFWNLILHEIEHENWTRFYDHIQTIYYNNHSLSLNASGSKGWQRSIFHDEIQGRFNFDVSCRFSREDSVYLHKKYPDLSKNDRKKLKMKLSSIQFSEMAPYYIMRYGFYEGHTTYRADPIAIAWIFGLKNLKEIENAFPGKLDTILLESSLQ